MRHKKTRRYFCINGGGGTLVDNPINLQQSGWPSPQFSVDAEFHFFSSLCDVMF